MAWLKAAFLCCTSNNNLETESRGARIVTSTNGCYHSRPPTHHGSPPAYQDISQQSLIRIDKKSPADSLPADPSVPHRSPSPDSSVVSVPSTRLTDLTALHTGDTALTSARASLERAGTRESRPPSYYSTLRRNPSLIAASGLDPDVERDEVWQHPVMRSDWFQELRQDARRHNMSPQTHEDTSANNARIIHPR